MEGSLKELSDMSYTKLKFAPGKHSVPKSSEDHRPKSKTEASDVSEEDYYDQDFESFSAEHSKHDAHAGDEVEDENIYRVDGKEVYLVGENINDKLHDVTLDNTITERDINDGKIQHVAIEEEYVDDYEEDYELEEVGQQQENHTKKPPTPARKLSVNNGKSITNDDVNKGLLKKSSDSRTGSVEDAETSGSSLIVKLPVNNEKANPPKRGSDNSDGLKALSSVTFGADDPIFVLPDSSINSGANSYDAVEKEVAQYDWKDEDNSSLKPEKDKKKRRTSTPRYRGEEPDRHQGLAVSDSSNFVRGSSSAKSEGDAPSPRKTIAFGGQSTPSRPPLPRKPIPIKGGSNAVRFKRVVVIESAAAPAEEHSASNRGSAGIAAGGSSKSSHPSGSAGRINKEIRLKPSQLEKQLATTIKRMEEYKHMTVVLQEKLDNSTTQEYVERLKFELSVKDARIKELTQENQSLRQLSRYQGKSLTDVAKQNDHEEMVAQENYIEVLTSHIRKLKERLADYKGLKSEQDVKIESLEKEAKRQRVRINKLKRLIVEQETYLQQVDEQQSINMTQSQLNSPDNIGLGYPEESRQLEASVVTEKVSLQSIYSRKSQAKADALKIKELEQTIDRLDRRYTQQLQLAQRDVTVCKQDLESAQSTKKKLEQELDKREAFAKYQNSLMRALRHQYEELLDQNKKLLHGCVLFVGDTAPMPKVPQTPVEEVPLLYIPQQVASIAKSAMIAGDGDTAEYNSPPPPATVAGPVDVAQVTCQDKTFLTNIEAPLMDDDKRKRKGAVQAVNI